MYTGTKTQLKKAIKNAITVYAYVFITADDGMYVEVKKGHFLAQLDEWNENAEYKFRMDEQNILFIN